MTSDRKERRTPYSVDYGEAGSGETELPTLRPGHPRPIGIASVVSGTGTETSRRRGAPYGHRSAFRQRPVAPRAGFTKIDVTVKRKGKGREPAKKRTRRNGRPPSSEATKTDSRSEVRRQATETPNRKTLKLASRGFFDANLSEAGASSRPD